MGQFLRTLVKEARTIAILWIVVSCLVQLAKCAPFLKESRGGLFAQPLNDDINVGSITSAKGFASGFVSSISMIIVSELGDKTFFIAAVMAMKHPRLVVFSGAISALALMTIFSGI